MKLSVFMYLLTIKWACKWPSLGIQNSDHKLELVPYKNESSHLKVKICQIQILQK